MPEPAPQRPAGPCRSQAPAAGTTTSAAGKRRHAGGRVDLAPARGELRVRDQVGDRVEVAAGDAGGVEQLDHRRPADRQRPRSCRPAMLGGAAALTLALAAAATAEERLARQPGPLMLK
jgi:hypothetical protein